MNHFLNRRLSALCMSAFAILLLPPGASGRTSFIEAEPSGGGSPPLADPVECLVNGSFELPDRGGAFAEIPTDQVPGWNTVNFNYMDFIPTWYGAHPDGRQAIELYSAGRETIYQDFETVPGDEITYSFYHRVNPDNVENLVEVRFGPPGATVSDGTYGGTGGGWTQYGGTYTVPAGQTVTRFEIAGLVPTASNFGTGNLIDAVTVQATSCPPVGTGGPSEPVDSDGDGIPDDQDAFPNDPNESVDTDGDGVGDNGDAFPNDPNESADTDGDGVGDNGDAFPNDPNESADVDADTIGDNSDMCLATTFPDDVAQEHLKKNRWMVSADNFTFVQGGGRSVKSDKSKKSDKSDKSKKSDKSRPIISYTLETTAGCSCSDIIQQMGLGKGHVKFGCSNGAMRDWVDLLSDAAGKNGGTYSRESSRVDDLQLDESVPTIIALKGNYPNPFNPQTTIRFDLPESAHVSLVVYDMLGREVRVLVSSTLQAGSHGVQFDASGLPSGGYLYRLVTPGGTLTSMMTLMK